MIVVLGIVPKKYLETNDEAVMVSLNDRHRKELHILRYARLTNLARAYREKALAKRSMPALRRGAKLEMAVYWRERALTGDLISN